MNFEKFTDRAKGFLQAAQGIALRENHQRLTPEHLLKALLDDDEGLAAGLVARAGGDAQGAGRRTEEALEKLPKGSGSAAGQIYMAPELARVFDAAEKAAEKAGTAT